MLGYDYIIPTPSARARVLVWVIVLGTAFHIVAVVAPYWTSLSGTHTGIWKTCSDISGCSPLSEGKELNEQWLRAVQAMAVLGVIIALFGIITSIVHLRTGNKSLLTIAALSAIGAGILVVLGAVIYVAFNDSSGLYWAFWFEVSASVIMLFSGVGLFTELCRG
ncbi:uncharacterized protein LOC124131591 isoform X2 [Haliotis rufescens]|uniref:uncharacterized protein LOC124131591 isoform X2 n=1 Tax=Haliotis rufescens TaxID=6454 RepID=UPI00201F5C67|nr:uncharacterized protein LOC124131591 isoform X2 [Haliotis rufescens]